MDSSLLDILPSRNRQYGCAPTIIDQFAAQTVFGISLRARCVLRVKLFSRVTEIKHSGRRQHGGRLEQAFRRAHDFARMTRFCEHSSVSLCYLRVVFGGYVAMAEKLVLVGVIPETVVIGQAEQVVWLSDSGTLKVAFDPNRCPFQSNVFQAPAGRQLQSGPPRPGTNPGSYKYRLWLNDQLIGQGEVILREK